MQFLLFYKSFPFTVPLTFITSLMEVFRVILRENYEQFFQQKDVNFFYNITRYQNIILHPCWIHKVKKFLLLFFWLLSNSRCEKSSDLMRHLLILTLHWKLLIKKNFCIFFCFHRWSVRDRKFYSVTSFIMSNWVYREKMFDSNLCRNIIRKREKKSFFLNRKYVKAFVANVLFTL